MERFESMFIVLVEAGGSQAFRRDPINRHYYHLFQPLLYQVATAELPGAPSLDIMYRT